MLLRLKELYQQLLAKYQNNSEVNTVYILYSVNAGGIGITVKLSL